MEEWKEYKLEEVTSILGDGIHGTPKYDDEGSIFFINGNNLENGKIVIKENTKRVSSEEAIKHSRPLSNRTILVSINGTLGNVAKYNGESCILGKSACYFNMNEDVDLDFIYYVVANNQFKDTITRLATGTTIKNVSLKTMREYSFWMPSKETQKRVSAILKSLDDKIEVNRRINEQLEELAGALFKSWFVDFEPFKDGEFVDSELGMIPKGWKVFELQELVHIKRGGSPRPIQNFLAETGYNWLKISDATSTSSPFIYEIKECIKEEGLSKTVFLKAGNLVLSNSATPGIPKFLGIDSCIHDGWLYFPKSSLSNEFLYLLFKYKRNYLISQGNGSVFTNLKTDIVKMLQLAIPDDSIISSFDIVIKSIFENIKKNQQEIHHLITLRDTLLPKLMSGEIDVNEVEI